MAKKRNSSQDLKKMKKLIALLGMILIVLIIFVLIANAHSQERILKKMIAGMDNLNYSYISDEDVAVKVFGKKAKMLNPDGSDTYIDYETKQSVLVYEEEQYKEEYTNNGIEEMEYYQQFIKPYFNSEHYQYKYLGKKQYNSKECIVVEFKDKQDVDGRKAIVRLWIDTSLYLIEKEEVYIEFQGEENMANETAYHFHTSENSLAEVQVPTTVNDYSSDTNN